MKVAVHVLMIVDPSTGKAEPIACNRYRAIVEQGMNDTADNMTLALPFSETNNRAAIKAGIDSLHIIEGMLEYGI